jgi:hypothetical protein
MYMYVFSIKNWEKGLRRGQTKKIKNEQLFVGGVNSNLFSNPLCKQIGHRGEAGHGSASTSSEFKNVVNVPAPGFHVL